MTLIETLDAYLNARLNERPHEKGYCHNHTKLETRGMQHSEASYFLTTLAYSSNEGTCF